MATIDEMMVISMARQVRNGERIFHGMSSPLAMVAILLAKRTHAPNAIYLNMAGGVDPAPPRLPLSTGSPATTTGSATHFSLADCFDLAARGQLDAVFLSGVQIDAQGHTNMSVIGEFDHPKVRLPGGAGGASLLPTAKRTILWRTSHDPRSFVERVSFVTAEGNTDRVITPLCVFAMRHGHLQIESVHPYSSVDEVVAQTGFALDTSQPIPFTVPPTDAEIALIHEIDPEGVRLSELQTVG